MDVRTLVSCALLFAVVFLLRTEAVYGKDDYVYGVIIDAGSSGSRIRVYRWHLPTSRYRVPDIREIGNSKAEPGISSYANDLQGLEGHVIKLVDYAKGLVPEAQQQTTAIYLMATAGMRLLLEQQANDVIDKISETFENRELCPFEHTRGDARILSGEEEGAFQWITVNYLRGYFDIQNTGQIKSAGILEMGGASTQIAFMPGTSILADKFPITLGGLNYPLYVHSYLDFGQNNAYRWVLDYIIRQNPAGANRMDNPCMFGGDELTEENNGDSVTFVGTGNAADCIAIIDSYVYKNVQTQRRCFPKPCAIGTVYQPTLDPDMPFYAVGAFNYFAEIMGLVGDDDDMYEPEEAMEAAPSFCAKQMETLSEETGIATHYLTNYCLMAIYAPMLFTKAYGFANDTQQIITTQKINGQPIEWAMGALLYEDNKREIPCYITQSSAMTSYNLGSYWMMSVTLVTALHGTTLLPAWTILTG